MCTCVCIRAGVCQGVHEHVYVYLEVEVNLRSTSSVIFPLYFWDPGVDWLVKLTGQQAPGTGFPFLCLPSTGNKMPIFSEGLGDGPPVLCLPKVLNPLSHLSCPLNLRHIYLCF